MSRNVKGSTDAHALRLIAEGRIVCDPDTGVVLVDGVPRGGNHNGYNRISCGGITMLSHRVVWLYCHGPIAPGLVINHLDGNRRNNRIANLEAVTQHQNVLHAHDSPNYHRNKPDHYYAEQPDDSIEALMQETPSPRRKRRIA